MTEVGRSALRTSILKIYEEIRPDLLRVEEHLNGHLRSDHSYLDGMQKHLIRFAGKRIRPALLLFAARATGGVREEHIVMGSVVEMLHNATLVHDDVLDEALVRRNYPTINRVWDNEQAIIFGDYIFAKTFRLAAELKNVEVFRILTETAYRICTGELLQLSRKYDAGMDEKDYYELIDLKTASLFEASCRLGCQGNDVVPEVQEALASYGRNLGIAFQVVDDWLDITGEENVMGKSLGTDITKGKITLPVIRLVKTLPPGQVEELRRLIGSPDRADEIRRRVGELVRQDGVLAYCSGRAREYVSRAKSALEPVGAGAYRDALEQIADFVLDRQS
jgi:octaprenyl-diphosphate synthase